MSVTIERVQERREQMWVSFITSLTEEERARLFDGATEMMLHDEYMEGNMSLVDIRLVLVTPSGEDQV